MPEACGDWDRDGDVDLFVQMGGAVDGDKCHNALFENPGQGNHWLTVKLVGKKTNRGGHRRPHQGGHAGAIAGDRPSPRHVRKQLRGQPTRADHRPGAVRRARIVGGVRRDPRCRTGFRRAVAGQGLPLRAVHDRRGPVRRRRRRRPRRGQRDDRGGRPAGHAPALGRRHRLVRAQRSDPARRHQSQGWARAVLDIAVAYGEDVTRVQGLLAQVGHDLHADPEWAPLVMEEPEVWGVEALSADSVVVRLVVKTVPLEQWRVARELRRRIKAVFDAEGVRSRSRSGRSGCATSGRATAATRAEPRSRRPGRSGPARCWWSSTSW